MPTSSRLNGQTLFLLLSVALLGAAALGLMAVPGLLPPSPLLTGSGLAPAPTGGAYEARLAKGCELDELPEDEAAEVLDFISYLRWRRELTTRPARVILKATI